MAENNWLLNDSTPTPLAQEFAAAEAAKAWGWFGMPAPGEGSLFEAAPAEGSWTTDWALHDSVPPFIGWVPGAPPPAVRLRMLMGVGI